MNDVGLILLAAGGSTRMGRSKQLLPYRGTTLLRHAAQVAMESGLEPVVAVLGAEASHCQAELKDLSVTAVLNPHWPDGLGGSIRLGVETLLHLRADARAVVIMLHDQPLISAEKLRALVGAWSPPEIVAAAAAYAGTFGVPALFDQTLFPELLALRGPGGAQKILQRHESRLAKIDLPEAATDIDSPPDYERVLLRHGFVERRSGNTPYPDNSLHGQ